MAQQNIHYKNQQWIQYNMQLKLTNKITLNTDMSLRKINHLKDWSQTTIRSGLSYKIYNKIYGVTGLACFNSYTENKWSKIEFRPYQEAMTSRHIKGSTLQHRVRIEARFFKDVRDGNISSKHHFNFRCRYRAYLSIPMLKKRYTTNKIFFNIGDEIFLNAGKEITYNKIDFNRFMIGFTYIHNAKFNFTLLFINQFGQKNSADSFENSSIITLGMTHKCAI